MWKWWERVLIITYYIWIVQHQFIIITRVTSMKKAISGIQPPLKCIKSTNEICMIGGRGVFNIQCTMSSSDQNKMEWPWHWLLVLLQAVHHSQHRDYPSDPTCLLVRSSIWWQELTQVTKALQGSWSWVTKTKVVWERHNTLSFVFHQH